MMRFDWPEGLMGRSSGWSAARDAAATIAHPPVRPRLPVALAPRWRALRLDVDADGTPLADTARPGAILVKTERRDGLIAGLSSGASSALVRRADGSTVRVKRCGFAFKGIGPRHGYLGRIGLMSAAETILEGRMLARFRAQGLCSACRPVMIEILADDSAPFFEQGAYATLHVAVTSDVRADEWFVEILRRELERGGLAAPVFRIAEDECFRLSDLGPALEILAAGGAWESVTELGRALGGFLRAVHDAGLLRGRGSVWMGNDVIGSDGALSAVDADGGARDTSTTLAVQTRIEAADYAAGFADCFSWGQQDWLAEPATILCEAFWEGYRALAPARITIPAGAA